ncbi:prepilin peptidase [Pseudarthrobacter sp. N5]|uniref:prepilin peptidase n=1 Tax=Pseudarthrobacter sp. N5 TaxID=3418416 RepID=UPI003CE93A17
MTFASADPLLIAAAGALGAFLAILAELMIARALPRLGGVPATWIRITTAAVTGALGVLLALRFGAAWELPAYLALAVLAVQLSRIDISHHLLPNPLVLILLAAGLVLLLTAAVLTSSWEDLLRATLAAAILSVVYLILAIISPGGIGMGDVKLAAPIGLYLGYLGWTQVFYGGALGFVVGGMASYLLLRLKRAERSSEVAYGPSMLAAALGVILIMS